MPEPTAFFLRDVDHGGNPDQPQFVADRLVEFVNGATKSIDIAIYDFQLDGTIGESVVSAIRGVAERIPVRLAYDSGQQQNTLEQMLATGEYADPTRGGSADWVRQQFSGSRVALVGINAPKGQMMHSKYLVRDAGGSPDTAAVWTGSTNFTTDAWTHQENNIIVVPSVDLAMGYTADFEQLWKSHDIQHTGNCPGTAGLGELELSWDFSPADGPSIDQALCKYVEEAGRRIAVASMMITSHSLLSALAGAVSRRGVQLSGIYDATQMAQVVQMWQENHSPAYDDWLVVSAHLVGKKSEPYTPTGMHNFMHNKVLVSDDRLVTGSYNFSMNAERNAENQVRIQPAGGRSAGGPQIVEQYAGYVADLVEAYRASRP